MLRHAFFKTKCIVNITNVYLACYENVSNNHSLKFDGTLPTFNISSQLAITTYVIARSLEFGLLTF